MEYRKLLKQGNEILKEAGIRDADIDAYLLLSHVSGKDRTFMFAHGEEKVPERMEDMYLLMIEKRAAHTPLQYITGEQEFMGIKFYVNRDVLIPRQDTELLVEEMMTVVPDGSDVLDICTGSGCILLSLMSYKNDIHGVGTDISEAALNVARRNAESLHKSATFAISDMLENVEGSFDYIVCNPPYIRTADIALLDAEVRDNEPYGALDGDADGMKYYRILADTAGEHLKAGGEIFMEIGFDQGEAVKELFENAGYSYVRVICDYSGNERIVRCLKD